MKRNIELLEKTMQYILDHPEKHNQGQYWDDCGTPSCFAGWAVHLSGISMNQIYSGGPWRGTGQCAANLLGLTANERSTLFSPGSSRNMLELMVKDLVNGDVLRDWQAYKDEVSDV